MEEKVQYQSEERLLDIKEHLQSLETKVTSMEHQQVQQQYLNIEGLDSTDARAIMMKLLNAQNPQCYQRYIEDHRIASLLATQPSYQLQFSKFQDVKLSMIEVSSRGKCA